MIHYQIDPEMAAALDFVRRGPMPRPRQATEPKPAEVVAVHTFYHEQPELYQRWIRYAAKVRESR